MRTRYDRHGTAVHEIGSIAKRILDIPIWVVVAGSALAARREIAPGHSAARRNVFMVTSSRSCKWLRQVHASGPPARTRQMTEIQPDEKTMTVLGLSSKQEITRTSTRVRTAMAAQTREQGRYLGGRPPYGYRLADAGPHPNTAPAAWGRRAHRLEPDPATAPTVRWMPAARAPRRTSR